MLKSADVRIYFNPYLALSVSLLLLALVYSPLVDFWPRLTHLVAFVERRFLLVLLLPLVLFFSMMWLMCHFSERCVTLMILMGVLVLAILPAGLDAPVAKFIWIEPGLFIFYFLSVMVWGYSICWSGHARLLFNLMLILLVVGFLIYAVICVYMFLFSMLDRVERLDAILPWGFLNIRFWSHLATWGMPLLPLALISLRFDRFKLWCFFVCLTAAVWWWILILSMSRGSMGALLTVIILIPVLFGRKAWSWLKWMLIFFVTGVLVWFLFSIVVPDLLGLEAAQRSIKIGSSGRWILWAEAWEMSMHYFPFGMGAYSWIMHDPLTPAHESKGLFGHPHNMYLFWAAEYGWWMVGGLFVVSFYLAKKWVRARKEMKENEKLFDPLIGLTASVLSAILHAGVSSVFLMPASMLMGLIVLGLFWAWVHMPLLSNYDAVSELPDTRYIKPILRFLLFVVAFCGIFWQSEVVGHYRAVERDLSVPGAKVIDRGAPRFWDNSQVPMSGLE